MTPSGIEPATLQLLAQYLNQPPRTELGRVKTLMPRAHESQLKLYNFINCWKNQRQLQIGVTKFDG
jgi:hypothetical protein